MPRGLQNVYQPAYQLGDSIESIIDRSLNSRGLPLPCKVVSRSGWFVSVDLMVDTTKNLPTLENIPVLSSKYIYQPIQAGDVGFLVPSALWLDTVTESATAPAYDDATPNLSAYAFLPLPRTTYAPNGDTEAVILDSPTGTFTAEVSDSGVTIGGSAASVQVTSSDVIIKTSTHEVSANALFTYLLGMQTQYNANFAALGKPIYSGTFE